ncbi:MAG: hypothetical protein J7L23_03530 [Candidatus Diapherotrites archaeon]|nr:hypothetical protein [Candidatus Diapherotrites archaeon]
MKIVEEKGKNRVRWKTSNRKTRVALAVLIVIAVIAGLIWFLLVSKGPTTVNRVKLPVGAKLIYESNDGNWRVVKTIEVLAPNKEKETVLFYSSNGSKPDPRASYTRYITTDENAEIVKEEESRILLEKEWVIPYETKERLDLKGKQVIIYYTPPLSDFDFPLYKGKSYNKTTEIKSLIIGSDEDCKIPTIKCISDNTYIGKVLRKITHYKCTDTFEKELFGKSRLCARIEYQSETPILYYHIFDRSMSREELGEGKSYRDFSPYVNWLERNYTSSPNATVAGLIQEGYIIYCDGIGKIEEYTHTKRFKESMELKKYENTYHGKLVSLNWEGGEDEE